MAVDHAPNSLDREFYLQAKDFFAANKDCALTYDDLSLATLYSEILPRDTQLETKLAEGLELHLPIVSADMDTVTESRMAIAMAICSPASAGVSSCLSGNEPSAAK